MKKKSSHLFIILLIIFLLSIRFRAELNPSSELKRGEIINKVICRNNPEQSYALFLPVDYHPEKKWPVIYIFDAAARGMMSLNHFKEAGEKYGYILVCSNNSRNGPWKPIVKAAEAVWKDTQARFFIDKKRIYTAGFSGGSRVASVFSAMVTHPVRGILGCGAGLAKIIKPEQIGSTLYCGIIGLADFNYRELSELDLILDDVGVSHWIFFFDGPHTWPPSKQCLRGVEWMELMGMKQKIRPVNRDLIDEIYKKEYDIAASLEKDGRIYRAVSGYENIIKVFSEWQDINRLEEKVELLKKQKVYKQFLKKEKKRLDHEKKPIENFWQMANTIKKSHFFNLTVRKIFEKIKIYSLIKDTKESRNIDGRNQALRILSKIGFDSYFFGLDYLEAGDYKRAIIFFKIAIKASINILWVRHYGYYNMACAYALKKDQKRALKNLRLAVENGFTNLSLIEKDKYLQSVRNSIELKEIIRTIKQKRKNRNKHL